MALALAGADLAGAAEVLAVEVGGKRAVRFHAAAGERNHLTVTVGKAGIRFADPSIVTRAATGCRQAARGEAVCEGERVEIRFGDRNDLIWVSCRQRCVPFVLRGGPGNDVLGGAARHDRIYGGRGSDNLDAVDGADALHGGSGPDALRGVAAGQGARASCGPGIDIVFPHPRMTVARDCEQFGETGFGYSSIRARGQSLRLGIKTLGCRIGLRIGRRGPVAVAEPRLARTPIRLALPHGGRTRVQLFGRRLCEGDSIFVPLFRIAGR